ncbi:MAG TPA: tRNA pseudouridine(13) synthase TruD, partial [Anaerolineae bacterium]|nr:tRNA pseudouridine(13) synthase TruD [Anaerolineae bacterium]
GSRRPVRYLPEGLSWRCDGDALTVEFFAPKGAFATMLLRELLKAEAEPDETAETEEEAE